MEHKYTCIIVDDEPDAIAMLAKRIGLLSEVHVAATYTTWEEALGALRNRDADIVFMDISMPGKTGFDLLKLVPDLQSELIFVTAHEEHALRAFDHAATGYLLKPVDDAELLKAIARAMTRVDLKRGKPAKEPGIADKVGIPGNKGIDYINVSDILYLESVNKCTRVVTAGREYMSSNNLGRFKELTDKYDFFQVHRSYIINLHGVVRYETEGNVIMSDKTVLPVSKNVRGDFLMKFERM